MQVTYTCDRCGRSFERLKGSAYVVIHEHMSESLLMPIEMLEQTIMRDAPGLCTICVHELRQWLQPIPKEG